MEYRSSRTEATSRDSSERTEDDKMSTLAMATPTPHTAFMRDFAWDDNRPSRFVPPETRSNPEKIALPSIRQAFPELQLQLRLSQQGSSARTTSSTTSPTMGTVGVMTPPEYTHSLSPNPNKRRRPSLDRPTESERASQVPRLYTSPPRNEDRHGARVTSPTIVSRFPDDVWIPGSRMDAYPSSRGLPSIRSPLEPSDGVEPRPTFPSLSYMRRERVIDSIPQPRDNPRDAHNQDAYRAQMAGRHNDLRMETGASGYRQSPYAYSHHPSRSADSIPPYDRNSFSAMNYSGHHHDFMRVNELGTVGGNGESKRRRRGNLPRETTEKLRAWFVGHLHHPYPTEDEKQDLMRQTGLAMNQISNWFINARRRQLPTLLSNARVESDATSSGRNADVHVLSSAEGDQGSPLSDGTASGFDEDLENARDQPSANANRDSV